MAFPPISLYPEALDSDYTLFLVHNTTESQLCRDNSAWSDEIEIVPVASDKLEIWADNGFGNIEGEMFYYGSVDKNHDGKVYKLKGCARQLTGKTTFQPKGTWVRGFVVAEHHNQIVDAILKIEDFIGYNFDPRQKTLDWRIRNLMELKTIFDDYSCPDIELTFNITENDPETGILAEYNLQITPPGSINGFRLDFGDGEFTTTQLSGTHRYALNAVVDPVVTASNDKCQVIQTPIQRENPAEPVAVNVPVFDIPIPEVPTVPNFTFVPCTVPEPEINLPPLVTSCFPSTTGIEFPSVIIGPDIQLVSQVIIEGPGTPINLPHSVVTIEGGFSLPSYIFVDMPPTIVVDPPIPPTIVVVTEPSAMTMNLNATTMPKLEVDWGSPPSMEVALTMTRPAKMQALSSNLKNEFGEEFADLFEASDKINVEYETVGFPTEIKLVAPELPIMVDSTGLPRSIKIETQDVNLPDVIRLIMENPLPHEININGPVNPLPDQIEVVNKNIPNTIEAININIPTKIDVELTKDIPSKIVLEMPHPIPDRIIVDGSGVPTTITINGIPETITVVGFPEGIPLLFPKPEDMPQIELVYKGNPIEFKITMAEMMPTSEDGKTPCFMMVPCPR